MPKLFELHLIPPLLYQFALTAAFSFVIGLEFHSYRRIGGEDLGFGTTRTFTLVGILGFVLYSVRPDGILLPVGFVALAGFLWVFYWRRSAEGRLSLLGPLLALLTYLVGPAVVNLPGWFLVLFVVTLLLMLGEKPGIRRLSDALRSEEIVTLAKFLIMAGVVLPLLPDRQIAPFVTVTYYQVWLALLVVSGLSYLSYLAQTYFFKERGIVLTAVLGGLYSSTAATVVIGRRARGMPESRQVSPALILATTMMYLRLLLLVFLLGYRSVVLRLLPAFIVFVAASLVIAGAVYRYGRREGPPTAPMPVRHPLEVTTAAVFALLFVAFAALTHWVVARTGVSGLHALSFAVGFTDIDPFILSLLAGKFQVTAADITGAVLIASGSNNLLKAGYAWGFGRNRTVVPAVIWLSSLCAMSLIYAYWWAR